MDNRLKKEKDFQLVFKKGKKVFSKYLTLVYLEEKQLKVGFAVSKKHGGSVKRNRIKRILRESFRSFMPFIAQNFFFVFIPKVSDEYDFHKIQNDMKFLLIKNKIIDKDSLC